MGSFKWKSALLACSLAAGLLSAGMTAQAADPAPAMIATEAETAAALGLLIGEGSGVDDAYLAKGSTRLQAAIISLRLTGKLQEALAYDGTDSFADAAAVGAANRPVLAYLKAHPELGWQGAGAGKFNPGEPISSRQLYKVLLEVMGYKQGSAFEYADTESFAASKGMTRAAGRASLRNADIAAALTEALAVRQPDGRTLLESLQDAGVVGADVQLPAQRIGIRVDAREGAYLTDGKGMALYLFTKDGADRESCQGQCLANWPLFHSESLLIPSSLNKADFGVFTRADGSKQLTYKGWPLYYWSKDAKPGDVTGQHVGKVWYLINPETFTGDNPVPPAYAAKEYRIEMRNYAFDVPELTVEAGAKVIFTNLDADVQHNAIAEDGSFKTPLLKTGESASVTFDKPGTYAYYCGPHKEHMKGIIIVK